VSKQALGLYLVVIITGCLLGTAIAGQTVELGNRATEIRLLNQDQSEVVIQIDIGAVNIDEVATKEGLFTMMTVDGFSHSNRIGEPSLPTVNKILSVPFGCELITEIVESEVEEFSLAGLKPNQPLIPVQPPLSKSADPDDVPFEYNRAVYQRSGYYSLPVAEAKILGTMRSLHLGMISISPFEYDPATDNVRVFKHLVVKISYLHPDWSLSQDMQRRYHSPMFEPVFDRLVNYESPEPLILDDLVTYPVKYLIISNRMFESQLQPFITWKKQKGFNVIVAYTDVIGSSASAIKTYIQNQYNNSNPPSDPAPSFVLLVGDTPQIPTWDGEAGSHVTDLRYCEFTGDDYPEIYYGRFSAQNTSQLQPQIDKTLEYEQYTMPDPGYLAEVTLVSGVDASNAATYGNGQINYGTNYYFNTAHGITDHTWLYPASDQSGASAAIIQTISNGVGFTNYTAHCGHTGWSDPSFTVSDIYALSNNHKYLLGIGNCCQSNTFGESTPCFGEAWLQSANKGGVGYIGGSNYTYWDEDYWWGVGAGPIVGAGPTYEQTGLGAYDGVFHDHGEALNLHYITNSAIIFAGDMAVVEGGSSLTQYYWEIYHLMGDPSVMNYMGVPSANTISHASTILLSSAYFTVTAAPASYVGISINGVLHGAAYVGQSGTVNVPLTPFSQPGTADIVVTAQNREPYISTVQVISPSGPYVIFDSYDINDISGNNNGELDAGENIILGVQLINVGPDNANNVTATLTSSDSYVNITDAGETYGSIAGNNGTVNRPGAFAFNISSNTPDGHNIAFAIEVTGTALDTWTSNFSIPVHSPDLGFVSVIINDASGNGNGILDPGETAQLTVTLINDGSGWANNLSGLLSENDGYVSIGDPNGTYGDIAPEGGTANNSTNVYVVSASSACPQGHPMTFQIALSAELGYTTSVNFDVIVGDRSIVYFDDFSTNQGWSGLGGTGEWTIGTAIGGAGTDSYGEPDPAQDHTPTGDNMLLGNDLTADGDYGASMTQTYWVTSPIIDCSDYTEVIMVYYRWLGIESDSYDNVYFQVYNGSSWITLLENGNTTIDETSWSIQNYDLSAYADENSDFRIRFGIGITDGYWNFCGWNIDDIEIKGYHQGSSLPPDISYTPASLADSLAEGESAIKYIKVRNNGLGNLRVRFTTSNTWLNFDGAQQDIAPDDSLNFAVTLNASGLTPGNYNGTLNFTANDPDTPSGAVPVSLHVYQPNIYIGQSSITETLESGEQSSKPLIIANNGPGRLNYSIDYETFDSRLALNINGSKSTAAKVNQPEPIGYFPPVPGKTDRSEPYYPPMTLGSGGPDAFGYRWIDSDEPGGPTYSWKDITSSGTLITGLYDDTNVGPMPIGFNFEFYGNTYNSFRFCTNGFISFTSTATAYTNRAVPTGSDTLGNLIAPFWDDLNFSDGGDAYYRSTSDSLIISYINVAHYSTGGPYTFQMILLANGKIIIQYQDINDPNNSATIGIQNNTGTIGLQVAYNQVYAHDNLAIQISAGSDWLDIAQTGGAIDAYSVDTVNVLFDAADLDDGDYLGQITVTSNDPDSPTIDIPVTLSVGLDAAMIELNLSSIIDTVATGESATVNLIIGNIGTIDLNYTVTDNRSWIGELPTNGVIAPAAVDTVAVTLNGASLPEGSYSGTVTINSNAINNSSVVLPVTLVIVGPPAEPDISLNLSAIVDTVVVSEYSEVKLIIGNAGSGDLNYTLTDDRSWINENPGSGTAAPSETDSITITLDASSLDLGTYAGTITVSSNDPDEGSVLIQVTLVVVEAFPACDYIPGDINGDGNTISSDITYGVNYFRGVGAVPPISCWDEVNSAWLYVAGDVNGDCQFIGADITYCVGFFRGINLVLHFCPRLPPYTPPVLGIPGDSKDGKPSNASSAEIQPSIPEKNDK